MERASRRYANKPDRAPEIAKRLPLTLIGYWDGKWATQGWPHVSGFVDEHWDSAERDSVASYLDPGLVLWSGNRIAQALFSFRGVSDCRFCGAVNGARERTDGVYVWPDGLPHYLREHGVRLPMSVIRHVVSVLASNQLPNKDEEWWSALHDVAGCEDREWDGYEWLAARISYDWWKSATLDS